MACDVQALMASAGQFQGLSAHELEVVRTQLIREATNSTSTVEELLTDGKCFSCLSDYELRVIITQLACIAST